MNNTVYNTDFTQYLPQVLKNDKDIFFLTHIVAEELQELMKLSFLDTIYSRIEELDENVLDVLAYDFHVDWYDYNYPIEIKRNLIKDSIKVHKYLGTKYAVETALKNVYPNSYIKEWFEYGGNPFFFRIFVNVSKYGINAEQQKKIQKEVESYKNLRSKLEKISFNLGSTGNIKTGAFIKTSHFIKIYPYMPGNIEARTKANVNCVIKYAVKLAINK